MQPVRRLSPEALRSLGSMEGAYVLPLVEKKSAPKPAPVKTLNPWPGWAAAAAVTLIAYAIHYLPFAPFRVEGPSGVRRPVSAAILAIFAGALAATVLPLRKQILEGAKHAVRRTIPLTIVLTGATLSFANATAVGFRACLIIVATMTAAMASAWIFGKMFGVWPRTSVLIGAGTAICGNSAIVAVAPLIDAEDQDVMLSMGAINVLGLVLMFVSPFVGTAIGLGDNGYGVWAGSTIHAVPQAVAAGFAFSEKAGGVATLVKLVRVALLAPLLLVLALGYARTRKDRVTVHYARLVPPFLWGFFGLFLLNSLRLLPVLQFQSGYSVNLANGLAEAGNITLALSMAAMGLEINLKMFVKVGGAAVAVGAAACVTSCIVSWALIRALL
ncbi:MAG TPA: putative sulfate exporter family transporter [Bryobacteraceae bacterium]|nr:putative sulfate exporter family transporter [Bryobacteraceae bacterium]